MRAAALLLPFFFVACALESGGFLLDLLPDSLSARLAAGTGRFAGDGWLQTSAGYALQLDNLQIGSSGLTLLGGTTGAPAAIVTLAIAAPVSVSTRVPATALGGAPLGPCWPSCGLGPGSLVAALLPIQWIRAEGRVRDRSGRRLEQPVSFAVDLTFSAEVVLRQPLSLRLDRRAPERLVLRALAELSPALGDGIDWAALPRREGTLCLSAEPLCEHEEAATWLQENLSGSILSVDLSAPPE